jgi:hypothetical protein
MKKFGTVTPAQMYYFSTLTPNTPGKAVAPPGIPDDQKIALYNADVMKMKIDLDAWNILTPGSSFGLPIRSVPSVATVPSVVTSVPSVPSVVTSLPPKINIIQRSMDEYCPGEDRSCPKFNGSCPDMTKYIRRDEIPCWNCTI